MALFFLGKARYEFDLKHVGAGRAGGNLNDGLIMAVALGSSTVVTVFGGSGFVGRYVVQALARAGCRIKVAVRRPDLAVDLQPLGQVGQIVPIQANVRNEASVRRAVEGSHAVVNLVGILQPSGKQKFRAVHVEGAERIAKAAHDLGVRALVHVSAIGGDRNGSAQYARTKGEGEARVFGAYHRAVILRPSVIFGPEDQFFNRFAALMRLLPIVPLIGGRTKFQPVYVGDVAQAIVASLSGEATEGAVYELGGPRIYTLKEIHRLIGTWTRHQRPLLPVPIWLAKIPAFFLQILPFAPVTVDQLTLLERDNVVSAATMKDMRTLEGLGVTPRTVELIVPAYLVRFRPRGEFQPLDEVAGTR